MAKCGKIDKRMGTMKTITVHQLRLLAPSREAHNLHQMQHTLHLFHRD